MRLLGVGRKVRSIRSTLLGVCANTLILTVFTIGKDLTWYAKASKADRAIALQAEISAAKQRDEDVMNEALYVRPHWS